MSKIVVIGDVHGKTGNYKRLVRDMPDGQRSVQIGDMGVGFPGVVVHQMSMDHRWFRGNHDDPAKCHQHPNYLGVQDWGFLPEDNLFWLAGAFSIDRIYRQIGVSWWQDEELSYQELQKAIGYYEAVKPRFVISHEAPAKAAKNMLAFLSGSYFDAKLECANSRTAAALQTMFDIWKPEQWIFGHYHVNRSFDFEGTKFTCVAELSTYDLETRDEQNDRQKAAEGISRPE
jgi:calcineurin-like phosphoesterase family protein